MNRLSTTDLMDMEKDVQYQPYASELRQYVDVRFDIITENGKRKYIPTWTIHESDNSRWEALRRDVFISADKIRLALWQKIIDDTVTQKRAEYYNETANHFLKSMNKYYSDMDLYANEIIGGLINEKLTPQLLLIYE